VKGKFQVLDFKGISIDRYLDADGSFIQSGGINPALDELGSKVFYPTWWVISKPLISKAFH